jgi:hypothetical protein
MTRNEDGLSHIETSGARQSVETLDLWDECLGLGVAEAEVADQDLEEKVARPYGIAGVIAG